MMQNNEKVIKEIEHYCINKAGVYETRPFGKYPICYRIMGKIFAQFHPEEHFYKITLKCEPEQAEIYRQLFPGVVVRGYHCPPVQQPYWNTIDLDLFTDKDLLYQMIDEAYIAITQKLSRKAKMQLLKIAELEFMDTDGENPDFAMLCDRLDKSLDEQVGTKFSRNQYEQFNHTENIHDVILVYHMGKPVACGSFKMYDEDHAELKRIYAEPSCRGMGLGLEIVRRLEAKAKMKGYKWCVLETGEPLVAASKAYKKAGYKIMPNYGPYVNMPDSICMERKI